MNTRSLRIVVCGLLAISVMVASQGCTSTSRRGPDGRPHKIRPHHHDNGLKATVPTAVVVQKRSTPAARKTKRDGMQSSLGTLTIDLTAILPSGCPTPTSLTVKCYPAVLGNDSGIYYVYNDENPLQVFGGASSATALISTSNPTASVSINVDNQSGNFFYIGASGNATSGGNTYTFTGGMILTKP